MAIDVRTTGTVLVAQSGEAELAITFTSELQPNKGVKVAGTQPAAIRNPSSQPQESHRTAQMPINAE